MSILPRAQLAPARDQRHRRPASASASSRGRHGARHRPALGDRCDRSGRRRARRCPGAPESRRAPPRAGRRPASGSVARGQQELLPLVRVWRRRTGASRPRPSTIVRMACAIWSSVASTSSRPTAKNGWRSTRRATWNSVSPRLAVKSSSSIRLASRSASRGGMLGLEHRRRVAADVAAEDVEGRLMVLGVARRRLSPCGRSRGTGSRPRRSAPSPAAPAADPVASSLPLRGIEEARHRVVLDVLRRRRGRCATAPARTRRRTETAAAC